MLPRPLLALSVLGSFLGLAASARGQRVLLEVKSPVPGADAVTGIFIGDWDGDGVDDLAIGAARDSTVANLAGAVRVHSGANGSVLAAFYGTNAIDYFGAYLARMPDMNGDGVDELAVSAPYADNTGTDTGSVFVYAGRTGALLMQSDGPSNLIFYGVPLGPIGDVDGDGVCDLYVSQYGVGDVVHVVSGANGSEIRTLSGATGEYFGLDVSAIHDVDGDGMRDLLIGAKHGQNANGWYTGAAYVVSTASGTVLRTHLGAFDGEFHGYGTAAVSDLDGDGVPDYAVASKYDDARWSAMARVYSGATGNALGKVAAPNKRSVFGTQIVGEGDLNGDGYGDFAMSGWWYDNNGTGQAATILISGKTLLVLDRIEVVGLGVVLSPGADFDRDGLTDVIAGIIDSNFDGKVRVYSGEALWLDISPSRPSAGVTIDFATREGTTGQPAILVLEDVDGTPYFQVVNGLGAFDATGGYTFSATVPNGLAGHDMTFKAYAHDASGHLIASAGQGVHFK